MLSYIFNLGEYFILLQYVSFYLHEIPGESQYLTITSRTSYVRQHPLTKAGRARIVAANGDLDTDMAVFHTWAWQLSAALPIVLGHQ